MNAELEKRIALKVFEEIGITIDIKDPIFALALICKEIVKEDKEDYIRLQEGVVKEIQLIPYAVGQALSKVAAAVEDSERTSKELSESTQAGLKAISNSVQEEAREALNTVARDQVTIALSQIKLTFDALEARAKTMGAPKDKGKKNFWPITALAGALLICIMFFPPFFYYQMTLNERQDKEIDFYVRELLVMERSISSLPKSVQDSLKRQAEKEKTSLK